MRCFGSFAVLLAGAAGLAATASADVLVRIDKSTQQMTVFADGALRWQWRVSTGRPGRDTPSGTFRAFRMEAEHYSKEFDDAPMPHSIFFTKVGHAVHGYLDTRHLGEPASHGCVRLDPANAAKLYALVQQEGVTNTTVTVTGSVAAAIARRRAPGGEPTEASGAPLALRPAAAEAPTSGGMYPAGPSYGDSRDDRFAPRLYRQPEPDNGYGRYAPPQPPPGYPSYPRPGFFIDNGR
jgi:L,D-transpeptidase catalytic domain